MKNNYQKKNGFTLVEVVIALVILVAIGLVVGVNLNRLSNKQSEENYIQFQNKVTSAADIYMNQHTTSLNDLFIDRGYLIITVGQLKEAGLLENDLINPETGDIVQDSEQIKVSLDAAGLIQYVYPVNLSEINEEYLQVLDVYLEKGESATCNTRRPGNDFELGMVNATGGLTTVFTGPVSNTWTFNTGNQTFSCNLSNVNSNLPGTYPVTYTYTVSSGETKTAVRNFIVMPEVTVNLTTNPAANSAGWHKASFDITTELNRTANITYSWSRRNGTTGSFTTIASETSNKIRVTEEGVYTYRLTISVKNYNDSNAQAYVITKDIVVRLDLTKPVATSFSTRTSTTGKLVNGNQWYSALTRRSSMTDNLSGMKKVEWCISTSSSSCSNYTNYSFTNNPTSLNADVPFTTSNANAQYLCMRITDLADNVITSCDQSGFRVDITAPAQPTISFSNTPKEINISGIIDPHSGRDRYECKYGTSSNNLNQTGTISNNKCILTNATFGTTYYVRVTDYNNAGLSSSSSVVSGSWVLSIDNIYDESCYGYEYCYQNGIYVKFRNPRTAGYDTYVLYRKTSTGYRAALTKPFLPDTSFNTTACCDTGACTYENNNFTTNHIGRDILNGTFMNYLPSNYSNYMVYATWNTGYTVVRLISGTLYETIQDRSNDRSGNAYVGLPSIDDAWSASGNAAFRDGFVRKPFWTSILIYGAQSTNSAAYQVNLIWYGTATPTGGTCPNCDFNLFISPNQTSSWWPDLNLGQTNFTPSTRPVIELKNSVTFTGGTGTKTDPYMIG